LLYTDVSCRAGLLCTDLVQSSPALAEGACSSSQDLGQPCCEALPVIDLSNKARDVVCLALCLWRACGIETQVASLGERDVCVQKALGLN